MSDQDEVDWTIWLEKSPGVEATLFEQVLSQSGGYKITLLVLDRSDSEDDDDREVRERSVWNPRFK